MYTCASYEVTDMGRQLIECKTTASDPREATTTHVRCVRTTDHKKKTSAYMECNNKGLSFTEGEWKDKVYGCTKICGPCPTGWK